MIFDWKLCKDVLPEKDGYYVTFICQSLAHNGYFSKIEFIAGEDGGWNCFRDSKGVLHNENRITSVVVAWAPIEPYYAMEEAERKELKAKIREEQSNGDNAGNSENN